MPCGPAERLSGSKAIRVLHLVKEVARARASQVEMVVTQTTKALARSVKGKVLFAGVNMRCSRL